MAGNCDICGEKLGFRKFHCQDGVVCKKCYAVVSNGFTETITKKTLAELKKTYEANAVPIDLGEDGFVVTRKIQSLLLIDEQNKKFCISGNPTVSKEYSRPEIYHYEDLIRLCDMYAKMDLVNPAAIIDANHSNSGKQFKEQIRIVKEVMHNRQLSQDIHNMVKGVMIESYIEEGSQKIHDHIYGKSITDPCLGWEDSKKLIYDIAEMCK